MRLLSFLSIALGIGLFWTNHADQFRVLTPAEAATHYGLACGDNYKGECQVKKGSNCNDLNSITACSTEGAGCEACYYASEKADKCYQNAPDCYQAYATRDCGNKVKGECKYLPGATELSCVLGTDVVGECTDAWTCSSTKPTCP